MIYLRPSQARGWADHGWLQSWHSFSFAGYYDPAHMGWGNLRVLNEDRIDPGTGFGAHPHSDMEIISYVIAGALSHQDSMGHVQTIHPGEVQRMTAGTGVVHSEFNHAPSHTHFLQIWLLPSAQGLAPSYEQRMFSTEEKTNALRLVASPDGTQGAVRLNADARLFAGLIRPRAGQMMVLEHVQDPARKAYVHVLQGQVQVNGHGLQAGDAALLAEVSRIHLQSTADAHVLVFDLAA